MVTPITDNTGIDQFIENARHNLLALQSNLVELGYEFANARGAVQIADQESKQAVHVLEERRGHLPALYRRWYESFRCVDFTQRPSQLRDAGGHRLAGLGLNCPLVFFDIAASLRLQKELESQDLRVRNSNRQELIPFGGSATNCEPKGVWIPDSVVDPSIYDEGAGPVTMSQEIIVALEAGGFPFWAKMHRRRRFTSPIGVTPAYEEVLPLLRRNLRGF
jgi:hypothetical protein